MTPAIDRRTALKLAALGVAQMTTPALFAQSSKPAAKTPLFKISIAEWSFHRTLGSAGPV